MSVGEMTITAERLIYLANLCEVDAAAARAMDAPNTADEAEEIARALRCHAAALRECASFGTWSADRIQSILTGATP